MVDTAPRRFSADKLRMLAGFADLAMRQLEKRVAAQRQLASSRRRAAVLACLRYACRLAAHSMRHVLRWPLARSRACLPQGFLTGPQQVARSVRSS